MVMRIAFCILPSVETLPHDEHRLTLRSGVRFPLGMPLKNRGALPFFQPFPYHLACAASYVSTLDDAEIAFRDSACLHESPETFLNWLRDFAPDAIVLEVTAVAHAAEKTLIGQIRAILPRSRICACGPWITSQTTREVFAMGIESCVIGEYENGVIRFVQGARGAIKSAVLSEKEMNEAPLPWMQDDLVRRYRYPVPVVPVGQQIQAMSSRGCSYRCKFCSWPSRIHGSNGGGSPMVRRYDSDYVTRLLQDVVARFSARCVHFEDDTFNLDPAHVSDICRVIEPFGLGWTASCRIDHGDDDDWLRMRDAGCYGVVVGLETGSQWLMDKVILKGVELGRARDRIEFLRGIGMNVCATFMSGIPGETEETRRQTENYRRTLVADCVQVFDFYNVGAPIPLRRQSPSDLAGTYVRTEADAAYFGKIRDSNRQLTMASP